MNDTRRRDKFQPNKNTADVPCITILAKKRDAAFYAAPILPNWSPQQLISTMLPHKNEDSKDGAAYGEVDTVEDIGRVPTVEVDNYHGLTLSVVLIYLVRVSSTATKNPIADAHDLSTGPHPR